jgi:glucose-6-phosphate-specific signal transduction histidine kinase
MRGRLIWGVALIAMGAFFLAQQFGLFGTLQVSFWAFAFGLLAVMFLLTFAGDRRQWWALIPGFILLGLTVMIVNTQNGFLTDTQAAALFLFSIGLPFLLIYLVDRRLWWALIPGGVLTVIALITLMTDRELPGQSIAAIIFFGLAIVFALVRFATRSNPYMGWATWVAIILAVIGALVLITGPQAAAVVGPAILIGLGLFLLARAYWPRLRSR